MVGSSKKRRGTFLLLAVLVVLIAQGFWLFFPTLRLAVRSEYLREIPGPQAQWVDAHRYDNEWFDAARAGRTDILQALYDAHYPVNSQTSRGYTAITLAAYNNKPEAVAYLLAIGADPCLADRSGNTALMGALYKGYGDMARLLLKAPCPIDQSNLAGETALSFAALFGRVDMVPVLVEKGADIDHVDAQGDTALAVALKQGNAESAAALRQLGASH